MRYAKNSPRLTVNFFNEDDELLFQIDDINWMEVGKFLSDHTVNELVMRTLGEEDLPYKVNVVVQGEFDLYE